MTRTSATPLVANAAVCIALAAGTLTWSSVASGAAAVETPAFCLELMDGTVITGKMNLEHVTVKTAYGTLKVPADKLIGLTPGLDSRPDLAEQISVLTTMLGFPEKDDRDKAQAGLIELGPAVRPIVEKLAQDDDPDADRKARLAAILESYKTWGANHPNLPEPIPLQTEQNDQVETKQFTIVGHVEDKEFGVSSPYATMTIPLSQVYRVRKAAPWKAEPATDKPVSIVLELRDGSRLKGDTKCRAMVFETSLGKLTVPLIMVGSLTFSGDTQTAVAQLRNGDRFAGKADQEMTLDLTMEVGQMSVPVKHLRALTSMAGSADGLAAYWSFDDKNAEDSVGRIKGTLVGAVVFEDGILGKAAKFQSHQTYIVVSSPRLNMNGWKQMSVSTWAKMSHYTTYGKVLSRYAGEQGCGFELSVGGNYGYWTGGGFSVCLGEKRGCTVQPATFAPKVQPYPKTGVWYHLVGTYDGERVRYYVNGKLDGEGAVKPAGGAVWDLPEGELVIGNAAHTTFKAWRDMYFGGLIDEVKIWQRALSEAEVKQLYEDAARKTTAREPGP